MDTIVRRNSRKKIGGILFQAFAVAVGLLVLFRANPSLKQNLFITALLWAVGAGCGMVLMLLGL